MFAQLVHRLSEDKRWDSEFTSQVRGTPWDCNSSAGEGIEDGVNPQRTDESYPTPLVDA